MAAAPSTTLRPPWLHLARAAWIALAAASLLIFLLGLAALLRDPLPDCSTPQAICEAVIVTQADVQVAREIGLPVWVLFLVVAGSVLARLSMPAVGLFIFVRRSDDWLALLLSAALTSVLVEGGVLEAPILKLLIGVVFFFGNLLFVPLPFIFPNGRFVPAWMRWIVLPLAVFLAAFSAINPTSAATGLGWLVFAILAVYALVYRYFRVSNAVERQQTKWVVIGLLCVLPLSLFWIGSTLLYPPSQASAQRLAALMVLGAIYFASYVTLAVCIAIAVLRYRLWDIDLIIRRTLIYTALTVALALVYFGSVVILQAVFRSLTGEASQLAVVGSTLAIAALFAPLRGRVQGFIDRRFFRRKYDATRTLADFAATARDETDLDALAGRLVGVVDGTMQPASMSLWLRPAERKEPL